MKPDSRTILSGILIFFVLVLATITVKAEDSTGNKVVLLIADRLSFEDVEGLPGFRELITGGSAALMNNRPSGGYSACKGYVNIGSGTRAEGTPSAVGALEVNEDVAKQFLGRTGVTASPGMVVNPYINKLITQNLNGEYRATVGSLGYYLHRAGLKTAVLGNCDCGDTQIRWAVSVAMDKDGMVDYGVVGEDVLKEDHGFPTGWRTDFSKLKAYTEQMTGKADFIVIETGDLTRIEESRDLLNRETYNDHRRDTLFRIDGFVKWIKEKADREGWLLIIVAPYPSDESIARGARLTPVIVYGSGFLPGLLTSGTTRREGIIAGIDIAPTVLKHFGIEAEVLTGRPLMAVPVAGNLERLGEIGRRTVNTSNFRYPILYNYAVLVIFVVILGLFTILYPNFLRGILIAPEETALIFIMTFPAILLMLPVLKLQTLAGNAVAAVAASTGLSVISHRYIKSIKGLLLSVTGFTAALIVLDIATGGSMIRNSVLGYDPIIGARYYGIGNEYMGVVTGSIIIAVCSLPGSQKSLVWIAAALLGIVVIVVGYPALGANLGGAITCFLTFTFFMLRMLDVRVGIKQVAMAGIAMAVVLFAFLVADTVFLEEHSHLAAAAQGTAVEGPLGLLAIMQRKAAMNLKLLRFTIWTKVLITVIAVTGVLFYKPVGIFKGIFKKYPVYVKGWSALVVAAAIGMAVNDSGVVTSATGSIFFISSMLYIVLQERKLRRGPAAEPQKGDGIQGFGTDGA